MMAISWPVRGSWRSAAKREAPARQIAPPAARIGSATSDSPSERRQRTASTPHAATADPTYHLLLCGPTNTWSPDATTHITTTWPGLVSTHWLSHDHARGVLHDPDGTALRRLGTGTGTGTGTDTAAHYLIRPDGHLAYRDGGTNLAGVHSYLTRWLINPTPKPPR